jgi:hypothetical protein
MRKARSLHRSTTIAALVMMTMLLIGSGLLVSRGLGSGPSRHAEARQFLATWADTLEEGEVLNGDGRPILVVRPDRFTACQDEAFHHPLLREAMAEHFRTVCLRDEEGGPAIVMHHADGMLMSDLSSATPSASEIARLMVAALERIGQSPPPYLQLIRMECAKGARSRAVFRAVCAWDGAAALGRVDGVLGVESGRGADDTLIEVMFDPDVISRADLAARAEMVGCRGTEMQVLADAPELMENPEPYFWLSHTDFRYLPLTPMQAMRINAALRDREDPRIWLSPRQIALLDEVELALIHDRRSLAGLERPRVAAELDRYTRTLRDRLDEAAARRSASVD